MRSRSFPTELHTLPNGLRVVLSVDRVAPVVAVNVWYNVGSRHERVGRTGLAHLFEHLMFEGSRQVTPGEHFRLVNGAGGRLNGTTSTERTNYFETLPSEHLDLALWLEADRMGGLLDALTEESLEKQRDVVRNERRQRYDNVPYGTAIERLCTELFPLGHPYHHQPIGSMDDLAAATLDDVRAFFTTHYAPGNAVLTIVGDFDPDTVVGRVERYFGGIPSAPPAPGQGDDVVVAVPPLSEDTRLIEVARVPDRGLYLGYRLPPEGSVALEHIEVALAALTIGRGSAFQRNLVRGELAKWAGAFCDRRVAGASFGTFIAMARDEVPTEKLEAALHDELSRLADGGPSAVELGRAKAMIERRWLDRVGSVEGRADELSRCTTQTGDPGRLNEWITPQLEASADDVRAAVAEYLVRGRPVTLEYVPETTSKEAA